MRVIVTGAFGALGVAVAQAFAADGGRVAQVDRAPAPAGAADLGPVIGGEDLADTTAATNAVERAAHELGGLDALVNIAGGFAFEPVEGGEAETFDKMWRINFVTAANMSRAAIPALVASGRGSILNVGAAAALKAGAGMGPYAAAKSAVHRLTEAMAEELKGRVRVNAVLPSILDTPQNRRDMPKADFARWVAPADLASVIVFLSSDRARAITGALIPVTGKV